MTGFLVPAACLVYLLFLALARQKEMGVSK